MRYCDLNTKWCCGTRFDRAWFSGCTEFQWTRPHVKFLQSTDEDGLSIRVAACRFFRCTQVRWSRRCERTRCPSRSVSVFTSKAERQTKTQDLWWNSGDARRAFHASERATRHVDWSIVACRDVPVDPKVRSKQRKRIAPTCKRESQTREGQQRVKGGSCSCVCYDQHVEQRDRDED